MGWLYGLSGSDTQSDLDFLLFRVFKKILLSQERRSMPTARATFLIAALSKAMASTITYPFSLAKTRLQIRSITVNDKGPRTDKPMHERPKNLITVIEEILRLEGATALYRGVQGDVAKGFVSHGVTMLTKDLIQKNIIMLYLIVIKLLRQSKKSPASLIQRVVELSAKSPLHVVRGAG